MRPLTIFVMLVVAGCGCGPDSEAGCGLAGASFDAKRVREEVENYRSAYLEKAQIQNSPNDCLGWDRRGSAERFQRFNDLLRQFPINAVIEGGDPVLLGPTGLRAAFEYSRVGSGGFNTIRIWNGPSIIVEERLPQAFRSPLLVAVTSLSGRQVIVATSRSRSTTGRRFLVMYSRAGELLYRNVHLAGSVWDIASEDDALVLLGCGQSMHIRLRDGA
jgi:hypothetical protein